MQNITIKSISQYFIQGYVADTLFKFLHASYIKTLKNNLTNTSFSQLTVKKHHSVALTGNNFINLPSHMLWQNIGLPQPNKENEFEGIHRR